MTMKRSVIYSSQYALLSLLGMIVLPVHADIILNDYTNPFGGYEENTNLKLNGDLRSTVPFFSWVATKEGDYSLTGSGTISGWSFMISASDSAEANFSIGSEVNLSGTTIDVNGGGTNASYAGTVRGGTTEKTRLGAYGGAVFDLSEATFEDDALISLRIGSDGGAIGGTIRADYTVNTIHNLSLGCTTTNFNTLDGNLVLADSGIVTLYNWGGET